MTMADKPGFPATWCADYAIKASVEPNRTPILCDKSRSSFVHPVSKPQLSTTLFDSESVNKVALILFMFITKFRGKINITLCTL